MAEKEQVSLGFRAFIFCFEVFVLALILGGAYVIDKVLLAPPLILSFRLSRVKIETKYDVFHMATIFGCMIVSTTICLFGLYLSMPISVSFISSVIMGVGFSIITWHIQDIINIAKHNAELQQELNIFKQSIQADVSFDADNCTEKELVARCKELKMSDDAIELAIELFIKKTKQSVIADKMCVEEKSIQQQKRRLRKKLNNLPKV